MNGNKPLVSVLIPAFNHEKYVQSAIYSIINQTYKNIELLILDDGSHDATWQKIIEMHDLCTERFVNVFMDKQNNKGVCETLNTLFQKSQGDFVLILDSDDQAKPNAIAKLVSFLMKNSDYVLVVGDNEIVNNHSQKIGWNVRQKGVPLSQATYKTFGDFLKQNSKIDFNSDDFGTYQTFLRGNYLPNGYLIRSVVLKSIGGFSSEAPLEDLYLNLQLAKYGKMKYLDEILFSYRWHVTNTVKRKEYMQQITNKTLLYEQKLVYKFPEKKWKNLFEATFYHIKFNFFDIIRFYKFKMFGRKDWIFEAFHHMFVLKSQKPK